MRTKVIVSAAVLTLGASVALAQNFSSVREFLTGYEEVPAVSTSGQGEFAARINRSETAIEWELSYADLGSAVQQAHIHLGQMDVNGGISVFLCTNLGNGPAGIQACPPAPAVISGTIMAADVSPNIAATAAARTQGLNTGEIDELIAAMRAGMTYVNVHTTALTGGEIRSQIDEGNNN